MQALGPEARRFIEAAWLQGEMSFVVCTCAFGLGINKPDCRWVAHFHPPLTLCQYIQEIGRAGRDSKTGDRTTLMSEPTGWLDPEDQQRRRFFADSLRAQQQAAQRLGQKLPTQGSVQAVTRGFKRCCRRPSAPPRVGSASGTILSTTRYSSPEVLLGLNEIMLQLNPA